MASLTEMGLLSEINCVQNKAYILNDNNNFSLTGYRILQSQEKSCFIKCAKVRYNGHIKLIYFSSAYSSLSDILSKLTPDNFINVIANLLSAIQEVQNNGFLTCTNIDISPESIFVESNTLAVKIICIPLNQINNHKTIAEFQNDFKTMLIHLIQSCPRLSADEKVSSISGELFNGVLNLQDLYNCILCKTKRHHCEPPQETPQSKERKKQPELTLTTTRTLQQHSFKITVPVFQIGRAETLEGVVDFSKAVSRSHCEIIYENSRYYVVDSGSTHGTFIRPRANRYYSGRIPVNEKRELHNGDYLKLADIEFLVSF